MKLAIISHTEHYLDADGTLLGWGPTITELNNLVQDFDEIFHIAFLHNEEPPLSSLPYTSPNIYFVPLKPVGGKGMAAKFKVLKSIPSTIKTVRQILKKVDVFQFRAPTGMGVFLIPYLTFFSNKKGWYKYAGNWNQENAPLGYALQRNFLKLQNRTVTINGKWPGQPQHCLSFENPCLTELELKDGMEVVRSKMFAPPFTFCFVGRLEDAKGVQRIIDTFSRMESLKEVGTVHLIGDGPNRDNYEKQCRDLELPTIFHGFLEREKVFEIYKKSHFFLLPSTASEGFPKVIAEAMNYGCIPIVSEVSSIGQYVNSKNGFIVEPCTHEELKQKLINAMNSDEECLRNMSYLAHQAIFQFTFENYRKRISSEILE